MAGLIKVQLSVNRRRMAKRLLKLFNQIAQSDALKQLSDGVYLPILDPDDAALQAHVTAVFQHVQTIVNTRTT